MNIPPLLMRLKIINPEHRINLWLPLFVIWLILLALVLLISPLVCVLVILLWPWGWGETLLLLGPALYRLLCGLNGLSIDIRSPHEIVLIYFK
jgi:hypothetical protein